MTGATDAVIEASVSALEFREAAWEADERGWRFPDVTSLSDPAILAVMQYPPSTLPDGANDVVVAEAARRGLIAGSSIGGFRGWCWARSPSRALPSCSSC